MIFTLIICKLDVKIQVLEHPQMENVSLVSCWNPETADSSKKLVNL